MRDISTLAAGESQKKSVHRKNLLIVSLLSIVFFSGGLTAAAPNHEAADVASYAGFAQIYPAKDRFIPVAVTRSTSRYKFWQERNDRE